MKLNKLVLPLTLAIIATLAATGCKKGFSGHVTQLPGQRQSAPTGGENPDLNTKPFDPNANGANSIPTSIPANPNGTIATADKWDPANCDQDRAALAEQTVHFAFDSAAILSKEENKLVIVSEKLKSDAGALLLIEGHCDERGTEEYNRALGERRALALREALARAGIDPARIRTISYGKDKPADAGHDESAWNKNRRGEFILCHRKAGA
jgi:peptidoglycan-associated lipoprotein